MKKGFSLIETLVVVALFAMVGIVVSQSTAVSLTGSRKADASSLVRENLNSAVSSIERQLRSAKDVSCPGTPDQHINFVDENGANSSFSCVTSTDCTPSVNTYVAMGSPPTRITNSADVCITGCEFRCVASTGNLPPTINVYLRGKSKNVTGVEDTTVELRTGITVRAY